MKQEHPKSLRMHEIDLSKFNPGIIVLFGSGETSSSGRKVFEEVFNQLPPAPRVALIETPAGFELNSAQVIGRIGEFLAHRLQNYQPQITIIPARMRGTPLSPDNESVVSPILESDLIFMGPGSPSYAVRQLKASLAWDYLIARHRLGALIVLASSAVVAFSTYSLPVYEIYKVGEDLHWKPGLDFFKSYGLPIVFIPHWNNHDGGEELDTSCCFMGRIRFDELICMLPPDLPVVGIDEKTAMIIDVNTGVCRVVGQGKVTMIHTNHVHESPASALEELGFDKLTVSHPGHYHIFHQGESFLLDDCCSDDRFQTVQDLPEKVWTQALECDKRIKNERLKLFLKGPTEIAVLDLPEDVQELIRQREAARLNKDWSASDLFRSELQDRGYKILDTPDGPRIERINPG